MRRGLGPYELVRPLGRGGMGEVFLAYAHGASGFRRAVAIKTLAPELVGEPALEQALIREAALAARLHHQNLVAVTGLGLDDGVYYVVMELVDAGDLAAHLTGPMPAPLALYVVCELALGLDHLHDARDDRGLPLGIVHRDVSPHNVLVSTTGDVKLADFGVAKATALADLTAAGARRGKYGYMSPEQLAGEPLGPASDQFGLGVTLVELVTGKRPFGGDTPWATMQAIRAGALDLPAELGDLADIARTALAVDPHARHPSIAAMRARLVPLGPAGPVELAAWLRRPR